VVDPNLIQQLVDLFTLHHYKVDAFSEAGVEQMQDIYKSMIKHYYPSSATGSNQKQKEQTEVKARSSTIINSNNFEAVGESLITTTSGFIYAPTRKDSLTNTTTIDQISVTSGSEADPDTNNGSASVYTNENNHIMAFPPAPAPAPTTLPHMMTTVTANKRTTFPSHFNYLSSRRGSKDSR
jgi:hypothetical protein